MPTIEPFRIFEIAHETGGRLALCRLPGRSGQIADDLDILGRWAPDILVSLTGEPEMKAYDAGALADSLAAMHIARAVFPIEDFAIPSPDGPDWEALAARLHGILDGGGAVLLHCLGGKGRSGMIAMRLLVERALAPAHALSLVRGARTGAVETGAQEKWATAGLSR